MKWIKTFLLLFCLIECCFSCYAQRTDTEKRIRKTDRLVRYLQLYCDTVYVFDNSADVSWVWYHKKKTCYLFTITLPRIEKQKFTDIWTIPINDSTQQKYFWHFWMQEFPPCFEERLDGEMIELYIKGQEEISCSIDSECLYSNAYEDKSFESYVIQILKKVIQLK